MSDVAIQIDRVSKQYFLGERDTRYYYNTLRESIYGLFSRLRAGVRKPKDGRRRILALDDLSVEIPAGEVVGIVGRNGAGKSTLLKILSRVTRPTSGEAVIHGRVGSLLEVGTGFHPELTGRENIFLNGSILGMRRAEIQARLDDIVAFAELEDFLETPVKRYSSGMYVRLAFAVAAHLESEILLVDEVLAVGDYEFQKKCIAKMDAIRKLGRTVLLVSHNMASVQNLCSRAILLNNGRLEMDGPAAEVVRHYIATHRPGEGEVVWPDDENAPGDDQVRLLGVRIVDAEGVSSAALDIQQSFRVQICYATKREGLKPSAGLQIHDQMKNPVFMSFNWPSYNKGEDRWFDRAAPQGVFVSECEVPGNLLAAGFFSLSVFVNVNLRNRIEQEVLTFHVIDTISREEMESSGVVRPMLNWQTGYLGGKLPDALPDQIVAKN